jgi:NAD(P)-dependent dehydrogenase (short-subunit alcohol dehydrogenase family)
MNMGEALRERTSNLSTFEKSLVAAAGLAGTMLAGRLLLRRGEDLHGQVALITGGTRGLGLLLAHALAREGCWVVICARDEDELEVARSELRRNGTHVLAVPCDVADRRQVNAMIRLITERLGRIDILVNNAGIIQVGPYVNQRLADFKLAQDVMFWGMLFPIHAVVPQMINRGSGRIVNITSVGGKVSIPHLLPYSCAKFAAVGLSEGLHAELAQYGIAVTTVVPGLMRTGSYLQALFKGQPVDEFQWFALAASLPGLSMSATRAAEQIVDATKRRAAECTLSLPANFLARFHGLWPGATAEVLAIANRTLLPSPGPVRRHVVRGREVHLAMNDEPHRVFDTLTAPGRAAAERYQHLSVSNE